MRCAEPRAYRRSICADLKLVSGGFSDGGTGCPDDVHRSRFFIEGVGSVLVALQKHAQMPNRGWLMLNGVCSLAVALLILLGLPDTSTWALGLLIGLNLLTNGLTMTMTMTMTMVMVVKAAKQPVRK